MSAERGACSGEPRSSALGRARSPRARGLALRELPAVWSPVAAGVAAAGGASEFWYWLPLAPAFALAFAAQAGLRGRFEPPRDRAAEPGVGGPAAHGPAPSRVSGKRLAVVWSSALLSVAVLLGMVRFHLFSSTRAAAACFAAVAAVIGLGAPRVTHAACAAASRAAVLVAAALLARSPHERWLWLPALLVGHGALLAASQRPRLRPLLPLAAAPAVLFAGLFAGRAWPRPPFALAVGSYAALLAYWLHAGWRRGSCPAAAWAGGLALLEALSLSVFGNERQALAALGCALLVIALEARISLGLRGAGSEPPPGRSQPRPRLG